MMSIEKIRDMSRTIRKKGSDKLYVTGNQMCTDILSSSLSCLCIIASSGNHFLGWSMARERTEHSHGVRRGKDRRVTSGYH